MADDHVAVLTKTSQLLEVMAFRGAQTVAELSDATNIPRSTIYRMLASLRSLGWVEEPSKRGHYAVGLGLLHLSRSAMDQEVNRKVAMPVLLSLRDNTEMTVYLHVVRGFRSVCVERFDGRRVEGQGLRIGGSLPLHAGAGARALLAFSGPDFIERWKKSELHLGKVERFTDNTPVTEKEIDILISRIQASGISTSSEDNTYGVAAVGAPIFARSNKCVAAVSVSCSPAYLADQQRRSRLVTAVTRAAARISELQVNPLAPQL
ncbi:IclR family transcriptional regulator [Brevibacterium sp. 'Marine']|uniref:IclR family transcriptional regulator n=1 Tax=Brevibacterium sp. 'Marine' TaxID=2725563 RepID=UPI00145D6482|nr:IclR family transcriptional regulator [Brevibacterium sp. 'Marine']